jgi:hypothetical protein
MTRNDACRRDATRRAPLREGHAIVGLQPVEFGFLPFGVMPSAAEQGESGVALTPFGASLGLAPGDMTGNFSHSLFGAAGPLSAVDFDPAGRILTLAGSVPEPASLALLVIGPGAAGLALRPRRAPLGGRRGPAAD